MDYEAHPACTRKMALLVALSLLGCSSAAGFTDTGSLTAPRDQGTATLLPGGKVLIAGGIGNSGPLAGAEFYDPPGEHSRPPVAWLRRG